MSLPKEDVMPTDTKRGSEKIMAAWQARVLTEDSKRRDLEASSV